MLKLLLSFDYKNKSQELLGIFSMECFSINLRLNFKDYANYSVNFIVYFRV